MMESSNPYQAPHTVELAAPIGDGKPLDKSLFFTWTFVFGINLIVPLLLGWGITRQHGRIGMCLAVLAFLCAGWSLCYARPSAAWKVIVGSVITAASQVFPVLHIIAGIIALGVVDYFESAILHDEPFGPVKSEAGGFLATFVVGSIVTSCAAGIGLIVAFLSSRRGSKLDTVSES